MRVELTRRAGIELRQYIRHVKSVERDVRPAIRERVRITMALEQFAAVPVDGVEATIRDWPRPVRMVFVHPFKVYYERHPDTLYVIRLHHHARRPIERR